MKNKLIIYKLYNKIKSLYIYDNEYSYCFHYNYFNETYKNINQTLLDTKKKISETEFIFHKIKDDFFYINDHQKKMILNMNREFLLQISVHQLIELVGIEEYLI